MPSIKDITNGFKSASTKIADTGKKLKRRYNRYAGKASEADIYISDERMIETVIRIPSNRIDRNTFLTGQFQNDDESRIKTILEKGPIEAGCSREELKKKAAKLIQSRTTQAFIGDIPEDISKSTAISDDTLSFFSAAVRLIQEIAYLYGESDFWHSGECDADKTVGRLSLYYSVMSGSDKATKALKLLSSSAASKSFNKITENLIEKTYHPIVKPAAKMLGVRMHKSVFDRLVSKAVPVAGNTISQGLTLASLFPMAGRLIKTLDEAQFAYSTYDFEADWYDITNESEAKAEEATPVSNQDVET